MIIKKIRMSKVIIMPGVKIESRNANSNNIIIIIFFIFIIIIIIIIIIKQCTITCV